MAQAFTELFSGLSTGEGLSAVLRDAEIVKISQNSTHRLIRLYITFHAIVPKSAIRTIERKIKSDCFDGRVEVKIIETFSLNEPYTAEQIYSLYKDSMLDELFESDRILYQIVKKAAFDFSEDGVVSVSLPDDGSACLYEDKLLYYLNQIFTVRFGSRISFAFTYRKPERDYLLDNKNRVDRQVKEVLKAVAEAHANEDTTPDGNAIASVGNGSKGEKKASSGQKKEWSGKGGYQKENGSFRGYSRQQGEGGFERRGSFQRRPMRSSDPDVVYGSDVDGDIIEIKDIVDEMPQAVVRGQVFEVNPIELKNRDKVIFVFSLYDGTDSISAKIFLDTESYGKLSEEVAPGKFFQLRGVVGEDDRSKELVFQKVYGLKKIPDFRVKRQDLSAEKRVELHCHTKMSDSDGVSDVTDIVKQAIAFGHKAIAITDHGVVQAFPDAAKTAGNDIKILYGMEGYLVDDTKTLVTDSAGQSLQGDFVVFDLETTGLNASDCHIIEIGAVYVSGGQITDRFSEFVNPDVPIPFRITEVTSIRDDDVRDAETIESILPKFKDFCKDAVLVAHNAEFDTACIKAECEREGIDWTFTYADTMTMAGFLYPDMGKLTLDAVAKRMNVSLEGHHRAVNDAECTAEIFVKMVAELHEKYDIDDLDTLNEKGRMTDERIRKANHPNHIILLAKNDIGRINLYHLVSMSHMKYVGRGKPRIPKSEIIKHREGLIIGSACEQGELFQAILVGRSREEVSRIASFYDYFEIQPIGNNEFYRTDPKQEKYEIKTDEDLRNLNRKIVSLGDEMGKPVVATCDVHFLNPEDEVYRRVILGEKHMEGADRQPPLYLHTTEEMLDEFSYLGADKAREVVITNTNRIADMCERIQPVRPDKCPPVIPDSDKMLRKICYTRAHELYGETLPPVVEERLERELRSIIGNGYAVMYIIAQKLVWKSNEDGYLVGSRGSVGSSFVATMAGITEVNPLRAHYLCPNCHYVDFDSDIVKEYEKGSRAGCDLPDKVCPNCGTPLQKMGFDIPFETFLGFKGNKEPDIDLNFSGDYQSKAHKYTEVIFGEGQTFKAGTVGTLADKTAYGYTMHYCEEHGLHKRSCEISRISKGCEGVRRTTGQHPGGIIVLPTGEDIDTFTPIQHPADKMDTDIVTTHFDYHKIDSNLLKLDILGHDDPTMIRMLEDLTHLNATKIPLDDKKVMSLFMNTEALGVTPDDLWNGCDMGTLGIPEFGTDFAMGLLREAKPKEFTDLIRISGLSHGTDVWQGNAEELIKSGTATISTAICCRDDIMTYLINMGLEPEESFTIMERVRKGVVAKGKCKEWPQYKEDMKAHNVPDWYIGSCEKIKYMFPKAHAAAYVMMAWRIAYCKVYYPLAYYAAFFSIRAKTFSYELMCLGKEALERHMKEYDEKVARRESVTAKEKESYSDMRLVQEFYARGFSFLPIDLYKSDALKFQIVDGKLLPPFASIDGMGDNASISLAVAAKEAAFLSKDDLRQRGKVPQSVVDLFSRIHVIDGLPESNQMSLFDMFSA